MTKLEKRLGEALRGVLARAAYSGCPTPNCWTCETNRKKTEEAHLALALFDQQAIIGEPVPALADVQAIYNYRRSYLRINYTPPERIVVSRDAYHKILNELQAMPHERIMTISNVFNRDYIERNEFRLFGTLILQDAEA